MRKSSKCKYIDICFLPKTGKDEYVKNTCLTDLHTKCPIFPHYQKASFHTKTPVTAYESSILFFNPYSELEKLRLLAVYKFKNEELASMLDTIISFNSISLPEDLVDLFNSGKDIVVVKKSRCRLCELPASNIPGWGSGLCTDHRVLFLIKLRANINKTLKQLYSGDKK